MDDPRSLFDELAESTETTDSTRFIRDTPRGPRLDFEIVERTRFDGALPETVREYRTQAPLGCGHTVTRENPFGGHCQGQDLFGRPCEQEYCSKFCAIQCPRCGISISTACCARQHDGQLICPRCRRLLRLHQALGWLGNLLVTPYLEDPYIEDHDE